MTFSSVDAARRTALALQGRRVDDPVWGAFTVAPTSRPTRAERDELAVAKNWRTLTKLRIDPARATRLLRALLVLTNLEVNR
jgi:hypothetical protein